MKIGILGCGAYGLALSDVLNQNNHNITMWTKFVEEKELLETTRQNEKSLKGYALPSNIEITTELTTCMKEKELLIIVIPSQFILELVTEMSKHYKEQHILIASKGIDETNQLLLHEIIKSKVDTDKIAVISGPSFAADLIKRVPTGLSLASENMDTLDVVKKAIQTPYIDLSITTDIKGVELCGALKNTIAISVGILDGLQVAESTKYMYITKVIFDIMQVLCDLGADKKTILSYSGIGDLLLTCHSINSRNYSYGKLLGQKKSNSEITQYKSYNTIEGITTAIAFNKLLDDKGVQSEIFKTMNDIILGKKTADCIIECIKGQ